MTSEHSLRGLKVVSLEQAVAAPLCTQRLAQAGAQVIKIERPQGDFARFYDTGVAGESAYFVWLNAGKKSVVLDLSSAAERQKLLQIIQNVDVLVQNLKPGSLAGLGVDLDQLHQARADFISVSISGFSPDGPGFKRKAYDLLMQAESGLAQITGSAREPGRVGVSIVDIATGHFAYEAILEALLSKQLSSEGAKIDISMFDAIAYWLAVPYLLDRYDGNAPKRVGLAHPGICPYGVFTSADEISFILSVQNEREWLRLCEVGIENPELTRDERCRDNPTRVANRVYIDSTIQYAFAQLSYTLIKARLDLADIAFAPVSELSSLKNHPDFHTQPIQVADQTVELPRLPGRKAEKSPIAEVPTLGEHTKEVLESLD
jgi:crotonobetainyl-CoA:carnitine CoA-transferase CaiB-like acyl-CoA transferase